jgi:hypothetical protein
MPNFFAELLLSGAKGEEKCGMVEEYNMLIVANSADEALSKAGVVGQQRSGDQKAFLGVQQLLLIHDEIEDGCELVWGEGLWKETDIREFLEGSARDLRKESFSSSSSPVGWHVGEIALQEIVFESVREEESLIWKNTYLFKESDGKRTEERLAEIGREGEADEHLCDGHRAMWKFLGISMICPVPETPADGSLLWSSTSKSNPQEAKRDLPSRDELGVFEWMARMSKRVSS